jgi:hypothetical protein
MLASACTDGTTGPGKPGIPTGAELLKVGQAAPQFAIKTASDALASEIPGFAGAYVADGVLNVYLTPDANTDAGKASARTSISNLLASGNRPQMPIEFRVAKHSLREMRAWEHDLKKFYRQAGVRTAQVDERNNRFEITVANATSEAAVRAAAATVGIPADILAVRTGGPAVVPFVDLNDRVRPAGGGLRILSEFTQSGVPYSLGCTYGFNAQVDDGSGTRYMITNAHCVEAPNTFGGWVNAPVYQPNNSFNTVVGQVSNNPAAAPNNTGCAPGDVCRESDAVLVRTNSSLFPASSWDIGGIHRTTSRGVGPNSGGSTTISGRIAIANASTIFFAGDTLDKIGSTTGWTAGVVTGTCVYHSDSGGGRMCNGVVAAGANHGDSGSPVFWKDPQGSYHLIGLLWGGPDASPGHNSSEFWFSRFQGIKNDLSPFNALLVTPSTTQSCNPPPGQQCPK